MNLPLCLTLSRIFLGPAFIAVYLYHSQMGVSGRNLPYILLTLTVFSELSDLFDGFLARKYNKVTELGKILDPMADSVFRLSVLLAFTQGAVGLPLLLVAVFFYRDSIISTLRTVCAMRGVVLSARKSGKVKAIILATLSFFILLLMIPYSSGSLSSEAFRNLSFWAVSATGVYVVYTGYEYIYANRLHIKKAIGL